MIWCKIAVWLGGYNHFSTYIVKDNLADTFIFY